ncbi:hypothetical protein Cgig2_026920 [Carnegiea gigantea]|uniref:Bidirectional sugar transporter SWEET n=1 Tax=Carnegiea gigantea TaxID=171969 RepID=A0A9Q1QRM8_9CARY|nr:hypothetical protein Cgig2_026920 [Carnegiea gigantea]
MLWALYGLPFIHPNSILVLTISAIGCLIELAYLLLFVIYSDTPRKKVILILTTLAEILAVGIIFSLVLTLAHTTAHRAQIIGVFGDISGVVMYASPLSVMKQVITTKSVEFMPLAVSVASVANALVWTVYAVHPFDLYVMQNDKCLSTFIFVIIGLITCVTQMPNGLGCFLGLAQLILYAAYSKSTKEQLAARKAAEQGKVGLKEVILVTVEPNKETSRLSSCSCLQPTFVAIWKKKGVEQYSAVPYITTFVNCMLWVLYGLPFVHPNSILVITINGAGCAIELFYLLIFILYSHDKQRLRVVVIAILEVLLVGIIAATVLSLVHTTKRRSSIVGFIAIVCNIMMYASPLSVMKMVITTKSVEYMPLSISVAAFANGVAWTVYAIHPLDPFIAAPNGLGVLFATSQLILYAIYFKSTKHQIATRKAKAGEVGLTEVVLDSEPNRSAQPDDDENPTQ